MPDAPVQAALCEWRGLYLARRALGHQKADRIRGV